MYEYNFYLQGRDVQPAQSGGSALSYFSPPNNWIVLGKESRKQQREKKLIQYQMGVKLKTIQLSA